MAEIYVVPLKTAVVEAFQHTFTDSYPEFDFRDVLVSIEFPIEQSRYPSIWVQYEDTGQLAIAGISHIEQEYVNDEVDEVSSQYTRWRFEGSITATIVALSSLERDRLYDEVVRAFAFTNYNAALLPFRHHLEDNGLIAINANFDNLRPFGDNVSQGTPWLTDEFVYEKSIAFDLIGEFVSDSNTGTILPLNEIVVKSFVSGFQDPPSWPDGPFPPGGDEHVPDEHFDPTQWH